MKVTAEQFERKSHKEHPLFLFSSPFHFSPTQPIDYTM